MEEPATASPDIFPTPSSLASSATSPLPPPFFLPGSDWCPSTAPSVPALSRQPQPQLQPQPQNELVTLPPELNYSTYCAEVLHLEDELEEEQLEQQLLEKARSLGVSPNRPRDPEHSVLASNALSVVAIATPTPTTPTTPTPPRHGRTISASSTESASTALTTHSSTAVSTPVIPPSSAVTTTSATAPLAGRRSKSLSFSQYDKYLSEVDPNLPQPKIQVPRRPSIELPHSIFNPKSYKNLKLGIKTRIVWKKRLSHDVGPIITCICCREDFPIDKTHLLRILPCGHTYCASCLQVIISQATVDESKMPPRCCTQPIPSSIVKAILSKEQQQAFLKAIIQFSTPWESRIFCPNAACGEFIPPHKHIDPKHPFELMCRQCKRRVCVMCKRTAHSVGQDCPDDWELDAVLKIGEKSGWRRCYKCRNLVELSVGCTHMTCRCKAQFCYICGALWDSSVGCPNFCNGEEELDRRRRQEEAREAEAEAERAARDAVITAQRKERAEAERRTNQSGQFRSIRRRQQKELDRFLTYEKTVRWKIWLRHADQKKGLMDKYDDLIEKMKERHVKTAAHLEDRQVAAEMELRNTLEHHENGIRVRLKHMEAYCDAEGTRPEAHLPPRVVTDRDRRELGQQYNVRDGMERLHQARINVMRDQQAKRMEELLERQDSELGKLAEKQEEEVEDVAAQFALEEDAIGRCLSGRRDRILRRWKLGLEILKAELEDETGLKYGTTSVPGWPVINQIFEYKLPPVEE